MRDIFKLTNALINETPEEQNGLRNLILLVTAGYRYKAPEQWHDWYDEMANLLSRELGNPDVLWKQRISDIFADKIDVGAR